MVLVQTPDIDISTNSLDFSRTPLGQNTDRQLTISNTGNQPLTIDSIIFSSFSFSVVGADSFAIPAGQNSTLTIRFSASVKGTYSENMFLYSDDPNESEVSVSFQAIAYSVNELHCGSINGFSGETALLSFSINNMEAFTGFQFDLTLPTALSYVMGSTYLTGRESDHVVSANTVTGNKLRIVCYSPDKELFTGNSGNVVEVEFAVSGPGGNYALLLTNVIITDTSGLNTLSDSYNGTLHLYAADINSTNLINFEDISILDTAQASLRIYNIGDDTLKIEQIDIDTGCYFTAIECPLAIIPSGYLDIPLKFHGDEKGVAVGRIRFISNDPDEYHYDVVLLANVYVPNYLIIPDLEANRIDTIGLPVNVNNYEPFTGFQFDLILPPCMTYIEGSATPAARNSGHVLVTEAINDSTLRVLCYSLTGAQITGDTGAIINLQTYVQALNGETTADIEVTNAILANSQEEDILWGIDNSSVTIHQPGTLTGQFTYNNSVNTPLDSLRLFLVQENDQIDSTMTGQTGTYSFDAVYAGDYCLHTLTDKPWSGVNGTDALKILRHTIHIQHITEPIRLSAADVNNSGVINATDALNINLRFVGLENTFAKGDWIFEKYEGGDSISMPESDYLQNFFGLCVGDVNGSNIPVPGAKNSAIVTIDTAVTIKGNPGDELFIPVTVDREIIVGAISAALVFPPSHAAVSDVVMTNDEPLFLAKSGILRLVWADTRPVYLLPGEPLFFIKVIIDNACRHGDRIVFQDDRNTEIADSEGLPIEDLVLNIPAIEISDFEASGIVSIYPNPARRQASLIFSVPEDGEAMWMVFDLSGRCIERSGINPVFEGLNKINLMTKNWRQGEYVVKLNFNGKESSFHQRIKFIISD